MSGKIFLSYRRDDSRWPTLSLYNLLAQSFPRERLFMDVEGYIKPGDDFVEVLETQVSACEVMVVVIGAQWLSLEKDGRPRIHAPRDFVHIEIATALRRKIRVIPALVDGAHMPDESELPEPLQALARRQAIRLSHERFAADGQGLVKALQEVLGGVPQPPPAVIDPALKVRPGSGEGFRDVAAPWCPEMVVVQAGSFTMGSPDSEEGRWSDEGPQVKVTIAKPFTVGRFAITRGEFSAFINETRHDMSGGAYVWSGKEWKHDAKKSWRDPGFAQDDSHPVVCVNWDDAKAYAKWLSQKTGKEYRLLSEAEWEYACRAGTQTPFWWGSSILAEQANYNGNDTYGGGKKGEFRQKTVPVKSFQPNPWGLYQVHGNVWEWCEDCWNENHHNAPSDGSPRTTGDCSRRVLRGGSWDSDPAYLRSAIRNTLPADSRDSNGGFRLART
jgi:formylglycine-generating enzyme required for sulfatase activity